MTKKLVFANLANTNISSPVTEWNQGFRKKRVCFHVSLSRANSPSSFCQRHLRWRALLLLCQESGPRCVRRAHWHSPAYVITTSPVNLNAPRATAEFISQKRAVKPYVRNTIVVPAFSFLARITLLSLHSCFTELFLLRFCQLARCFDFHWHGEPRVIDVSITIVMITSLRPQSMQLLVLGHKGILVQICCPGKHKKVKSVSEIPIQTQL